jgi:hypothetical protein
LATPLRNEHADAGALVIDGIVVSKGLALVEWHADFDAAILQMTYRFGRWWIDQQTSTPLPLGITGWGCGMHLLTSHEALVPLADGHLPSITRMLHPPASRGVRGTVMCGAPAGRRPAWSDPHKMQANPYSASLTFASSDAPVDADLDALVGRAPTEAESWANQPSGNSYFFFSGTVQSPQPVHVQAGTKIDVWFPFVLDTSLKYSLTIGGNGFTAIGPVDGTLADNTLHFVLPAFTVAPGVELMGEIESD